MSSFVRFIVAGLILGLFTEFELKLVAGVKPSTFIIALFVYPVLISLAFAWSALLDRMVSSSWKGDVFHYITSGLAGLAFEWVLLGNGPGSNAIQLGMWAMWTTFCFGPRVLTRSAGWGAKPATRFWIAFAIASGVLSLVVLLASDPKAKIVIAVLGLSATYLVWSTWLLVLGWRCRTPRRAVARAME